MLAAVGISGGRLKKVFYWLLATGYWLLMNDSLYIAVDLGAGSGRVFLCGVGEGELLLEEVHRFQYPPSRRDGHLRWNLSEIFAEIKKGLGEASKRARELGRSVQSIGVDSWGVD